MPHWIIDAHEDLAYNMLTFKRDYRRSALETRRLEQTDPSIFEHNQDCTIGYPEYQLGQIAVVFSTIFAAPKRYSGGDWETQTYAAAGQGEPLYRAQLDLYRRMADESPQQFRLLRTRKDLREHLAEWQQPANYPEVTHPTGLILLMEGAEGLRRPQDLEDWYQAGLRIVGPVWSGIRYCGGTNEPGGFTRDGWELLQVMAELDLILDIAHMTEKSALQAMEEYPGRVIASHANARALLQNPTNERHLTNQTIRRLVERDGVMGLLPFNSFLKVDWKLGDDRSLVTLATLADQVDYICQLAGSARNVAIGTDFDGGFGFPRIPEEMNTIADLQKLPPILLERGYTDQDVALILGENWRRLLDETLPEG